MGMVLFCARIFLYYIELYQKWSAPVVRENKQVVIAYASCYGYTKMLAEKIAEGIRHAGIENLKVLIWKQQI